MSKFNIIGFSKWVEARGGKVQVDEASCLVRALVPLKPGEILAKTRRGHKGNIIAFSKATGGKLVVFPGNVEYLPENRLLALKVIKETSNSVIAIPLLYQNDTLIEEGQYKGFMLKIRWIPPYAF